MNNRLTVSARSKCSGLVTLLYVAVINKKTFSNKNKKGVVNKPLFALFSGTRLSRIQDPWFCVLRSPWVCSYRRGYIL